jgi:hypothetical protein
VTVGTTTLRGGMSVTAARLRGRMAWVVVTVAASGGVAGEEAGTGAEIEADVAAALVEDVEVVDPTEEGKLTVLKQVVT